MPRKKSEASASLETDHLKPEIVKRLVMLMDEQPPLGERYASEVKSLIDQACSDIAPSLGAAQKSAITDEIFGYATSLGPITPLFEDPQISEIMINGANQVFYERDGELFETGIKYDSEDHVRLVINSIINPLGRFVNYRSPMSDAHLPDGSRVNVVIPPIAQQGSCISIRRFLKDMLTIDDLIRMDAISDTMAEFLEKCVQARLNIIVAGNTSSGKTTLLNVLAKYIPNFERILTIEDAAELQLHQLHKISLEARPADYRGEGKVTIRDLVRNSLRMRPDRIIVGEVRGGEALDMLQAMNTGHDGSMTTVHSNSPRDTLSRIETMTLMAGVDIPITAIRKQIAAALNLIVYLTRFPDGTRKVTQITEVVGMESDVVSLTDIFIFQQTGVNALAKPVGQFKPTGLRPMFSPKLEALGYKLGANLFSR